MSLEPDNEDQWWPRRPDRDAVPLRSGDMVAAALGPLVSLELSDFVRAAKESGVQPSERLARVFERIDHLHGRKPAMFLYLTVAASALQQRFADEAGSSGVGGADRYFGESLKHFGSWLVEAAEGYGLSLEDFEEYVRHDLGAWPPPGAAYSRRRPDAVGARSSIDRHQHDTRRDLEFWGELTKNRRPTLLGAHLVVLRNLRTYVLALTEALEFAYEDVAAMRDPDASAPSWRGTTIQEDIDQLEEAVAKIAQAQEMIREAQGMIVDVFPT